MRLASVLWAGLDSALSWAVCAILFALMALTFADVVGRYLFNSPIPGTAELTELGMGVLIYAGLPLVTARREQITVGLLDWFIPRGIMPFIDAAIALLSAAMLGIFAWRIGAEAAYRGGFGDITTYLHLPIAPFAWLMSAMAALSALLALVLGLRDLRIAPAHGRR